MTASWADKFTALVAEHGPALNRLAASYTRSASDRDDLLQDIAIALWQALPRFRGDCSERTFVFRIAHNRCIANVTKRRPIVALDEHAADVEDPRPNAEAALTREQQNERLLQAVRSLPVIYRQVLVLTLEGLDYREVAQVLGISESNVGARLTRARQQLRALLKDPTCT